MTHGVGLLLAVAVTLAGTCSASNANQSRELNAETRQQEFRRKKALGKKVISWLSDANDLAGVECDRLADSLLKLEEPSVSSYFIAAQVADLRNRPHKAIAILRAVITKHPDEKAPIGIVVPVKIAANFWIGAIARHSRDVAEAKRTYQMILRHLNDFQELEGKEAMAMMCNFYLAEIESQHLKRGDRALARLEAIERIKKPPGQLGAGYEIYYGWAAYQRASISKGKAHAAQQLRSNSEVIHGAPLIVGGELKLSGIGGGPLVGWCVGPHRSAAALLKTLASRVIQSTASPIDRTLVRLAYGFYHQEKGRLAKAEEDYVKAEEHYAEAEKHYSAVFEEDSYFSPVAGIYAAQCRKAQGRTAEAEGILKQVRARYPGYDAAVIKLKESWHRNERKDTTDD